MEAIITQGYVTRNNLSALPYPRCVKVKTVCSQLESDHSLSLRPTVLGATAELHGHTISKFRRYYSFFRVKKEEYRYCSTVLVHSRTSQFRRRKVRKAGVPCSRMSIVVSWESQKSAVARVDSTYRARPARSQAPRGSPMRGAPGPRPGHNTAPLHNRGGNTASLRSTANGTNRHALLPSEPRANLLLAQQAHIA